MALWISFVSGSKLLSYCLYLVGIGNGQNPKLFAFSLAFHFHIHITCFLVSISCPFNVLIATLRLSQPQASSIQITLHNPKSPFFSFDSYSATPNATMQTNQEYFLSPPTPSVIPKRVFFSSVFTN